MDVRWLTAFLDLPAADWAPAVDFWTGVTGYRLSPLRGEHDEFATLLPPDGADDHLCVQRLASGPGRIHLDLTVADPGADLGPATAEAERLGARVQHRAEEGYVVLLSPGGLTFCFVTHPGSRPAPPAAWPGGRSVVDQVCLDVPGDRYDAECAFWAALTGWQLRRTDPEFQHLVRPPGFPVRLLLQRLAEPSGSVRAHLDLAADDREAETRRHEALGARVDRAHDHWTVLADPVGTTYCITDREPA